MTVKTLRTNGESVTTIRTAVAVSATNHSQAETTNGINYKEDDLVDEILRTLKITNEFRVREVPIDFRFFCCSTTSTSLISSTSNEPTQRFSISFDNSNREVKSIAAHLSPHTFDIFWSLSFASFQRLFHFFSRKFSFRTISSCDRTSL